MTEPQVRGTDTNQDANALRDFLETHRPGPLRNGRTWAQVLDAALDWERRRTVERIRERVDLLILGAGWENLRPHQLRTILREIEADRG